MTARRASGFNLGINCYVPGMQYAADMTHGQPVAVSLGAPAASAATAVAALTNAQAVAGTEVAATYLSDSPFGRTLKLTISGDPGAAGSVVDVYGYDYLRQPMVERFTGGNGLTAILYGKKAFYGVTKSKIVTASTNAVTFGLGTGFALGLPYKGDVDWAKENNILIPLYKRDQEFMFDRAPAEVIAGTAGAGSRWVRTPFPGYVKNAFGIANGGGGGANEVITVKLGGTAITGISVTIVNATATGVPVVSSPTTAGYNANNRFRPGDPIELASTAAAGGFGDRIGVLLASTQFVPADTTDPQTVGTTGDPRGTYESLMTMDGVKNITVGLIGDNAVNASGNGGLFGIRHVIS